MSVHHSHMHMPHKSTRRFLLVVLAYLIVGTLLWYVVGVAMPGGHTSNPPFGHPQNQSVWSRPR